MPTVQIEPLRVIGSPLPDAVAAERLDAKISDAFARFDTINVASNPIAAQWPRPRNRRPPTRVPTIAFPARSNTSATRQMPGSR